MMYNSILPYFRPTFIHEELLITSTDREPLFHLLILISLKPRIQEAIKYVQSTSNNIIPVFWSEMNWTAYSELESGRVEPQNFALSLWPYRFHILI